MREPSRVISAGVRARRTMVASRTIATASPTPSCLMTRRSPVAKPMKTTTISAAAMVMIRPVRWIAWPTAVLVSAPSRRAAMTAESRKTS